jgi:hypothetical protein
MARRVSGGVTPAVTGSREREERNQREEGEGDVAWLRGPLISEGEASVAYRFGDLSSWAVGWLLKLGRTVPFGPFLIFILFSSFCFLFSYSFHNFCKNVSIQAKPIS